MKSQDSDIQCTALHTHAAKAAFCCVAQNQENLFTDLTKVVSTLLQIGEKLLDCTYRITRLCHKASTMQFQGVDIIFYSVHASSHVTSVLFLA
eukprot:m.1181 g.1181  ORF g.1181 m.1181 type:complete len:93 (+) comp5832_c0_seq1:457-735(+)